MAIGSMAGSHILACESPKRTRVTLLVVSPKTQPVDAEEQSMGIESMASALS